MCLHKYSVVTESRKHLLTLVEEFTIAINGKPIYATFAALVHRTMLGHHLQQPPQIHNTDGWAPHSVNVAHAIE